MFTNCARCGRELNVLRADFTTILYPVCFDAAFGNQKMPSPPMDQAQFLRNTRPYEIIIDIDGTTWRWRLNKKLGSVTMYDGGEKTAVLAFAVAYERLMRLAMFPETSPNVET
jgi:hypothetical protein